MISIKSFWEKLKHNHFFKLFFAALFLACTIEIIKHHDDFILPEIENLAFFISSNLSTENSQQACHKANCTVIAKISDERFKTVYLESSPINRCKISDDIDSIYTQLKPKTLFIDYDLSPVYFDKQHQQCEQILYDKLDELASKTNVVTFIRENVTINPEEAKVVEEWKIKRQANHIHFIYPRLELSHGQISTYEESETSFVNGICRLMHCKKDAKSHYEQKLEGEHESPRLNFTVMIKNINEINIEDLSKIAKKFRNGFVLLGGMYGSDDKSSTPIGEKYRVEMLAGAYESYKQPVGVVNKIVTLILDVLLGICVGFIAHLCWNLRRKKPKFVESYIFPTLVLLAMLLFSAVAIYLSLWVAEYLLTYFKIWLNPIPIVIGMIIHSFIMSPAESPEGQTPEAQAKKEMIKMKLIYDNEKKIGANGIIEQHENISYEELSINDMNAPIDNSTSNKKEMLSIILQILTVVIFGVIVSGLYLYFT